MKTLFNKGKGGALSVLLFLAGLSPSFSQDFTVNVKGLIENTHHASVEGADVIVRYGQL